MTLDKSAPAKSGRPPLETIAEILLFNCAPALKAAAAPVLAPKKPTGKFLSFFWLANSLTIAIKRSVKSEILNQYSPNI